MFDLIIVRYAEIGLKSESVRKRFERQLIENIRYALNRESIVATIQIKRGRIFLITRQIERALEVLKKIFGVASVSPSAETSSTMKSIIKKSLEMMAETPKDGKTFAVRVRRTGNHDFTSQDVAVEVGREIKEKYNLKVNLEKPDIELFVEVRDEKSYLFFEKIKGPGGLPAGTQGKILSLIRNRNDILALWYMLRRGCSAKLLVENEETTLNKFVREWYVENHVEISYGGIEENLKGCIALVTGETMDNINLDMDKFLNIPVLRPLVSFDENRLREMMGRVGL
ncbi:MAG: hypothetical protein J7K38_03935 [Thermoplasmata archaeon]|nr:hypothetical protein [Thermoplasmata archaeon]